MKKLDYVDKHDLEGIKFGLDNIYELLESFGNPQKELKAIHIAGTNGKGSVGAYLLYILASAGYKVGRLSSPAVFEENEFAQIMYYKNKDEEVRCRKNMVRNCTIENIPLDYLKEKTSYLTQTKLQGNPSGFEVQVAISLLYFKEKKCDIVIIETGMGGTLDATNVFENTLCDVITPISFDHMNMLGNTLEEIALNKYGIITRNGNVITTIDNYKIHIDGKSMVEEICNKKNAKLYLVDKEYSCKNKNDIDDCNKYGINNEDYNIDNNVFEYKHKQYKIRQNGKYQIENAKLAIEVINVLKDIGYNIDEDKIKEGLQNMHLKGRFDILCRQPIIIADGAHNEAGVKLLLESIDVYFKNRNVIFVTSIFRDKDYKKILEIMANKSKMIIGFETDNARSLKCDEMGNIYKTKNLEEALRKAIDNCENDDIIVCAGSLSFMRNLYKICKVY